MITVSAAFLRAVKSLASPRLLWHLLWPTVLSVLIWLPMVVVAARFLGDLVAQAGQGVSFGLPPEVMGGFQVPVGEMGRWMTWLLFALALYPIIYITSAIVVAVVGMPLMLAAVARQDYRDVRPTGGGGFWRSLSNALGSSLMMFVLLLLSIPLWFIPGGALLLPLVLGGWFNQRTYPFDALMNHATWAEMSALRVACRGAFWRAGLATAALSFVPILNFFAPAFSALVFIHLCLDALRALRAGRVDGV